MRITSSVGLCRRIQRTSPSCRSCRGGSNRKAVPPIRSPPSPFDGSVALQSRPRLAALGVPALGRLPPRTTSAAYGEAALLPERNAGASPREPQQRACRQGRRWRDLATFPHLRPGRVLTLISGGAATLGAGAKDRGRLGREDHWSSG